MAAVILAGMRQRLACLYLASTLGGCSLIYNPNQIASIDAAPDAPIDADPSMLAVTGLAPVELVEGQGAQGSRAAVVVIEGSNLVRQNTTVTITAAPGAARSPMLTVDDAQLVVSADGTRLAVPVTLPVDPSLAAGESIELVVTVTQDAPSGPVSADVPGGLRVAGLDELTAAPATGFPGGTSHYSRIELTTGAIRAATGTTEPIVLRSTSSITLAPEVTVDVSASGRTGGPGGGTGGTGGAGGLTGGNAGTAGTGPAPGLPSGGPGRFEGDDQLTSLAGKNRGSGGAGGDGEGVFNGSAGGDGGGGGGSLALLADGELSVGDIAATGAAGQTATNPGGGGSGGVVWLRAGGTLTAGSIDVASQGNGQPGRVRVDAAGALTVTSPAAAYRGPMFEAAPSIVTAATPSLTVIGNPLTTFQYYVMDATGAQVSQVVNQTIAVSGRVTFEVTAPLHHGLNQVCLLVPGASPASETRSCIQLAYLIAP